MSLRISRMAGVVVLASALASTAQAQDRLHLGPRVSYQFDLKKIGIGAQFSVPIASYLEFYPSFDVFLNSNSYWNLNADLKYRMATQSVQWLYLGAGLNLAKSVNNPRAGLNLFAGVESRRGWVHPFGEFRFTARHGSTAQISAGLNFTLGSH